MASSKLLLALAALSLFALVAIGCAAPTTDTDEPQGETEEHLLSGSRLTPSQVATQLRSAGFAENTIGKMVCTAKYESSYYEKATNKNKNGSTDYGLFQINSVHLGSMKGCPSSSASLFDPATNAKCALAIFKSQGVNAWYGYQKHKSECDKTRAPGSATTTTGTPTTVPSGSGSSGSVSTTSSSGSVPTTTSSSGSTYTGDDDDDSTTTATTTSSSGSSGTDTSTDDSSATIDPDTDYDLGGGCWSATMQDMMGPLACVQSASDNAWEQCKDGKWYRGTDVQGPYGYCNGTFTKP